MKSIFERYPYIKNLRSLISDEIIISEIEPKSQKFDVDIERAAKFIKTVNLNKIFPAELEQGSITLENFLGHWGNVSIEELCKICLIVKYFKPKNILEIGTYNGMTTLQMALNAPDNCTTYTIDLPDEMMAKMELSKMDYLISKIFKEKFGTKTGSYFNKRKDINIVQKFADSATFDYSELGTEKMDIVFIDAAHDYQNKKIDSENAFRIINKNGVIIWHNYNDVTSPGVTSYLADISEKYEIFHLRNTMLAIFYNHKGTI